jgi:hypothetical protein
MGTRGAPGAALSREVGAGALVACGAPGAALSQEVGAGAVETRGAPGAALRRETGDGSQATRGAPGAALNRKVGTTQPPPLPRPSVGGHGVAPSRSGPRCFYLAATLLGLPPPLHDFDDHDHLNLGYLGIKGLPSACGTRRFLLQSQHSRHHDAATVRGYQFIGFYLRLILQSHHLWCSRCDCGGC